MPEGSPTVDRGLRQATQGDILRLKSVLAEAFYDDPIFGWLMPDAGKRRARLAAAIDRRHGRDVPKSHYYVRDIGVLPEMQGNGLGSTLLRPTLERCDHEGLPAYLEASSERNAALYERLGFQLTTELRVAGSPPLRLMLRLPRSPEATS